LTLDDGFMEIAHGDWEGLLASEIRERDGQRLQAWRDAPDTVQMPGVGGESLHEVLDRAWPAFARACAGLGTDDTLLVVAHDAVNRVLLCRVLGIPLSKLWGFRLAPTTLNLLEGPSVDALEVVRLNDCSHHTALFGEAVHRAL
ncbi:MAG: histidine phosphatase family protein, partial [Pseudomonadota bacterium]